MNVIMDDPGVPGQRTLDIIMIKWIFDVMGDPGAPGQLTLNVIMVIDIMDDPGAPGQVALKVPSMEQCKC